MIKNCKIYPVGKTHFSPLSFCLVFNSLKRSGAPSQKIPIPLNYRLKKVKNWLKCLKSNNQSLKKHPEYIKVKKVVSLIQQNNVYFFCLPKGSFWKIFPYFHLPPSPPLGRLICFFMSMLYGDTDCAATLDIHGRSKYFI